MRRSAFLALAAGLLITGSALAQNSPSIMDAGLNAQLDAAINPKDLDGWMKLLAAEPNQVASPPDKSNAERILKQYQRFGWDAHIEPYDVLYPTPLSEDLSMPSYKGRKWSATLQE